MGAVRGELVRLARGIAQDQLKYVDFSCVWEDERCAHLSQEDLEAVHDLITRSTRVEFE